MLVGYIFAVIMMLMVLKSKYSFKFSNEVFVLLAKILFALSLCLISIKWLGYPNAYFSESLIVLITIGYSLVELNKRMNLKEIFLNMKNKIKK
jgi:hypothetical protein